MRKLFVVALLICVPTIGFAQTRTVAKTGSPDHTTIQAAIDFFDPDPDPLTPNVVQILDATVYDEIITIDVPITIEGTGASRPIIAARTNPASAGDGVFISIPTGTFNDVTLRNLIIIPSRTSTPTDDGLMSTGQNLNILLDNVLITSNNGADQPVSTTGLVLQPMVGVTQFGDDGAFLGSGTTPAGSGTWVTMVNTVITHNQGPGGATNGDALVCSGSSAGGYLIQDGCVFSWNGRLGIQGNGSFEINAPNNRVLVIGNGSNTGAFAGIWFAGVGSGASPVRILDGVNVLNNFDPVDPTQGWGIEQQNGGGIPFVLRNAIIAGNLADGLLVGEVGTTGRITVEKVTIAGNGRAPIRTNAAHTGIIDVTDCIIAGDPLDSTETIQHNGTGALNIAFSGVVTQGPLRLKSPPFSGTGPVNQTSVISDNPMFLETSNYLLASFFDVDNTAYGGAGSGGSDLAGGADYIGGYVPPPISGLNVWQDYR